MCGFHHQKSRTLEENIFLLDGQRIKFTYEVIQVYFLGVFKSEFLVFEFFLSFNIKLSQDGNSYLQLLKYA